jgi:sodium/potassium/calcium exchanger 6
MFLDLAVPSLAIPPPIPRLRAISNPALPRLQIATPPRHYSRSPSPTSPYVAQLPSFSILGALEFREVIASLKNEAAATSLSYFESPVTSYAGGHYHVRNLPGARSPQPLSSPSTTINEVQMGDRLRPHSAQSINDEPQSAHPDGPNDYFNSRENYQLQTAPPSIYRIPPSPTTTVSDTESDEQLYTPLTKRQRIWAALEKAYHILFPTLHNFGQQNRLTRMACILAAPAVLFLTLTLPVVVTPYNSLHASHEKIYGDARLVDFEEEGIERTLIAEQEVEENMHELTFSKWLTAVQCVLGPLFCVQVLFGRFPWSDLADIMCLKVVSFRQHAVCSVAMHCHLRCRARTRYSCYNLCRHRP